MKEKSKKQIKTFAWIFAVFYVLGMLLLEPALERKAPVKYLSDITNSYQYLVICPLGELVHFFPQLGRIQTAHLAMVGIGLILISSGFCLCFFENKRICRLGIYLMLISGSILLAEFFSKKVFYLGPAQLRYLAMNGYGLGLFLLLRERKFLATMIIMAGLWDISSAIFWAWINKDIFVHLPVPYWGRLEEKAGGAPALVPILIDSLLVFLGAYIIFSKTSKKLFDKIA